MVRPGMPIKGGNHQGPSVRGRWRGSRTERRLGGARPGCEHRHMSDVRAETTDSTESSPAPSRADRARVSARIGGIAESSTLAVDAKAKALKAAGRPVIG